jgi:hypothetical protein
MREIKMNNKKLLTVSIASVFACMPLFAITNEELAKRLEKLEIEVKDTKKQNEELKTQLEAFKTTVKDDMKSELGGIEDRIDGVETGVLLHKVNLGLGFKNRLDFYNGKRVDGTEYHSDNVWTTKLHLNMDSKITDDMKFSGRLAMYKYWSTNYTAGNSINTSAFDAMQGRRPSDSSLFVERAYVDYILNKNSTMPVTLTMGRQPSSDGPSHQFKENTSRKSTYSALGFDGAADGIVATVDLEKTTGMANTAVRVAYGKGYQAYNTSSYVDNTGGAKDTPFWALFIDGSIPNVDGSLLQLGYVKATNATGYTGGANIGNISMFGVMAEFTNIKDSGVDLFAHYGVSQTCSNSETVSIGGASYGLLSSTASNDLGQKKRGSAFWVGGRYSLPYSFQGKIGYEYNRGSQNWFSFIQGSADLTNKLSTRGDAHEVYYIQPINRYAFVRAGAQFIKYKYTNSGSDLGSPIELGSSGTGSLTKSLENYYLLFNILF